MSAAMEAGDVTFVRTKTSVMTTREVIALLEDVAARIESERGVSFRTKDAIRLMVKAVTEALE